MGGASLAALWRGDMPLAIAFWRYLFGYGLVINLAATLAAIAAAAAGFATAIALMLHFLPVPYNALAAIGVWRSAERDKSRYADAAKLAAAGIFLIWIIL
jgi:hypothetical protein